jgi:hypothetical protein
MPFKLTRTEKIFVAEIALFWLLALGAFLWKTFGHALQ